MSNVRSMEKARMLLEARRRYLYKKMSVPEGWHDEYASGRIGTDGYKTMLLVSFQGP